MTARRRHEPLTADFDAAVLNAELPRDAPAGFSRYRAFELLSEGGKAQVFRCIDGNLGREVAVKLLHCRLAHLPIEHQLLVREARIMAALQHPAVPQVHDLGRDADGRPYLAMTLKYGATLHETLTGLRYGDELVERIYDLERLLAVLVQLARALEFAHQLNVVHCDLKPENVIVDPGGVVSLIDWGLAVVDDPAPRRDGLDPMTQKRGCQGSAQYMAPEQVAGADRLTRAVDVYGLGALLYECLTLATPHRGQTARETLSHVTQRELVPPSHVAPHRDIPSQLDEVCLRALARAPDDRFASMIDFRLALEDCRADLLIDFEREQVARPVAPALGAWDETTDCDRATARYG